MALKYMHICACRMCVCACEYAGALRSKGDRGTSMLFGMQIVVLDSISRRFQTHYESMGFERMPIFSVPHRIWAWICCNNFQQDIGVGHWLLPNSPFNATPLSGPSGIVIQLAVIMVELKLACSLYPFIAQRRPYIQYAYCFTF